MLIKVVFDKETLTYSIAINGETILECLSMQELTKLIDVDTLADLYRDAQNF